MTHYPPGSVIPNHGKVFDPFDGTSPYWLQGYAGAPPCDASKPEYKQHHDWVVKNLKLSPQRQTLFVRPDYKQSPDEFLVVDESDTVKAVTSAIGLKNYQDMVLNDLQIQLGVPATNAKYASGSGV